MTQDQIKAKLPPVLNDARVPHDPRFSCRHVAVIDYNSGDIGTGCVVVYQEIAAKVKGRHGTILAHCPKCGSRLEVEK